MKGSLGPPPPTAGSPGALRSPEARASPGTACAPVSVAASGMPWDTTTGTPGMPAGRCAPHRRPAPWPVRPRRAGGAIVPLAHTRQHGRFATVFHDSRLAADSDWTGLREDLTPLPLGARSQRWSAQVSGLDAVSSGWSVGPPRSWSWAISTPSLWAAGPCTHYRGSFAAEAMAERDPVLERVDQQFSRC